MESSSFPIVQLVSKPLFDYSLSQIPIPNSSYLSKRFPLMEEGHRNLVVHQWRQIPSRITMVEIMVTFIECNRLMSVLIVLIQLKRRDDSVQTTILSFQCYSNRSQSGSFYSVDPSLVKRRGLNTRQINSEELL